MDELPDGFTALFEGACQLHEYYTSLVRAGFTPEQAMQLVIALLAASVRPGD